MTLHRAYTWAAGSVLALSITAYALADQNIALLAIAVPLAIAGWVASSRTTSRFVLPRWLANTFLFLAIAYAASIVASGVLDVTVVARLVVALAILKTGDRRGRRDDAQILLLSVFLGVAAMLDSNQFVVGVILAILVPLVVLAVMLFQLHPAWRDATTHDTTHSNPATGTNGIGRWALAATLGIIGLATIIFLIMPRGLGESQFGALGRIATGSITGYTEQVSLGRRNVISESPEIVMDVAFSRITDTGEEIPLGSEETTLYLRGAVLESYSNGQWNAVSNRLVSNYTGANVPRAITRWVGTGLRTALEIRFRRSLSPTQGTPIFSRWRPISIRNDRGGHVGQSSAYVLSFRPDEPGPLNYRVESISNAMLPPSERPRPSPPRLPIAGLRETLTTILTDAQIPLEAAERAPEETARIPKAIEEWLRRGFTYSLEERIVPANVDPIAFFLTESRTGHCEYFASAMTALCREAGIDARVVTGYVAAEFNQSLGTYTVRQSHAHAWVEAGAEQWDTFDPTPPADLIRLHRPQATLANRVRAWFDSIEYAWNRSFVGFDERQRQTVVGDAGRAQRGWVDRMSARMAASARERGGISKWTREAVLIAAGITALAAVIYAAPRVWRRLRTRRTHWHTRTRATDRLRADLLRRLRQRGVERPVGTGLLDHARQIELMDPEAAQATRLAAELIYTDRFAGGPIAPRDLAAARRVVSDLANMKRS